MESFKDIYLNTLKDARWNQLEAAFTHHPDETEDEVKANIIALLNIAFIDEELAEYNYLASYTRSITAGKADYDPEFEQHEKEQNDHKHQILIRLRELDAKNIMMVPITKWHRENSMGLEWKQEYGTNSYQLLLNRLAEEEAAVKFYTLCVEYTRKTNDSTTLRLFKKIKEEEERHVLDLRDLAREVNPTTEQA